MRRLSGNRLAIATAVIVALAMFHVDPARAADDGGHTQVSRARVLNQTKIPVYSYKVVKAYPHDRTSYTEGLQYVDGAIYEGRGLYGRSGVRKWDLKTGRVLEEATIDPHFFGEGVTVLDGKVFELTYLGNTGFVYDAATFERQEEFRFVTQGWGLTNDGHQLIMSNGSSAILFLDPLTREVKSHVFVTDDVGPVGFLNELEYVDGTLRMSGRRTSSRSSTHRAGKLPGGLT
jgi:glutamine cyclotransferase